MVSLYDGFWMAISIEVLENNTSLIEICGCQIFMEFKVNSLTSFFKLIIAFSIPNKNLTIRNKDEVKDAISINILKHCVRLVFVEISPEFHFHWILKNDLIISRYIF